MEAPNKTPFPDRTSIKLPADYPKDLYWNGEPPKEDYSYVLVNVKPGEKTKFTLSRCRPWSAEPFATVEDSHRKQRNPSNVQERSFHRFSFRK